MTASWASQYRTLTTLETAADDGYGVRFVRDAAANINNYVYYSGPRTLLAIPCIPPWSSHDSTATERVIAQFCPMRVPQPYDRIAVSVGMKRTSGAGTITWKMYLDKQRYDGGGVLDTTELSPDYKTCSFVCDSDADTHPVPQLAEFYRSGTGYVFMMLTATNSNAPTRGYISSLSFWEAML